MEIEVTMPLYEIRLSLTGSCNHRCIYCGPFSDGKANHGYKELSLEQIEEIAPFLKKTGLHIQLTGGEPTLHRHLIEIIKTLNGIGIDNIGITTNGSRLNLDLAEKITTAGISDVHIHMPSLDYDVFKKTTGDQRREVVNNIKKTALYLKKIGKGIEFNTPVTSINLNTLSNLIDFCFENKINLKLAEEVSLSSNQIKEKEIIQIFEHWFEGRNIKLDQTNIDKKYGRIYNFGEFYFRVAPATKGLVDFLNGKVDVILYDGRYWIGGREGKYLFTPSYFLKPKSGNYEDLRKNLEKTSIIYENHVG